jgi:hypothetical protein
MAKTLEDEVREVLENAKESGARYQSATGTGFDIRMEGIEDAIHALARAVDQLRASPTSSD